MIFWYLLNNIVKLLFIYVNVIYFEMFIYKFFFYLCVEYRNGLYIYLINLKYMVDGEIFN